MKPATNYRWTVVALLFFATTINYIDRQVLGLLKPFLQDDFKWTETDYSHIVMAFTTFYAAGMLAFGKIIDRIGTRIGYTISIILWSVAAMGHALVKTTFGFSIARAALGIGEAGNFPAAIKAVAEWFPKRERAYATGLFNSGANIGAILAPATVYWLQKNYGWQSAFICTGAIGFIWLIAWLAFYHHPSTHKKVSASEIAYINSDSKAGEPVESRTIPWVKLFTYRQAWVYIVGKFFTDPVWYFFLFWLPSYFKDKYHVDIAASYGLPIMIVYSATTVGSIGGGYLSSWFIKRGWPVYKARKISFLIFACCVVPIISARFIDNIWVGVTLISLAAAAHQAWSANIYTTVSDMFPRKVVSSVIGIGGMAGSAGGILFPMFIGFLLDHYKALGNINIGYNIIFFICGCAYLVAWVLIHFISPKMIPVKV
ncbi:MAG TPA: MFS transporter [Flavitalea sp.]|nr:MFS transporter [Flavitalea sp.]